MKEHIHSEKMKSKNCIKEQYIKLDAVQIGSQATEKVRLKSEVN